MGLFCAVAGAEPAVEEGLDVGQRWQYRHEGPRPGNVEPNAIDGERILQVISVAEEQGGKQWVIEERFTHSADVIGRLCVNQELMLTAIEIENKKGEVARLRYDPPIPYRVMDLAAGEKRKIETTLKMDSPEFALPSTITIERLEDESITTPAGEFAGCPHYRTVTTSTVNIKIAKIPFTEEREQWYHPRVHGMVKEVYRKGPVRFLTWSRPGYTATSVLTAFGREEVMAAAVEPVAQTDANDGSEDAQEKPESRVRSLGRIKWVLLGAAGILTTGGLVFAKWARRK